MMAMNPMETRLKADECADFYQSCIAAVSDDAWDRRGHASGFEFSVRSIAWIAAGHTQHHSWDSAGAVSGIWRGTDTSDRHRSPPA